MSKDKYIPKVGDKCVWVDKLNGSRKEITPVFISDLQLIHKDENGLMYVLSLNHEFEPVKTKESKEREILEGLCSWNDCSQFKTLAMEIQKAGFTIPKKVKPADIESIILEKLDVGTLDAYNVTSEICELLGDLVED